MALRTVGELVGAQEPLYVERGDSVRAAAQAMKQRRVGAAAVVEKHRAIGVFTERDVMCRVVAEGLDPDATTVGEVMTSDPQTMDPGDTIFNALERMIAGHFRHMPVVADGRLVGMLSIRDIPFENQLLREKWLAARRELERAKALVDVPCPVLVERVELR